MILENIEYPEAFSSPKVYAEIKASSTGLSSWLFIILQQDRIHYSTWQSSGLWILTGLRRGMSVLCQCSDFLGSKDWGIDFCQTDFSSEVSSTYSGIC